MFDRELNLTICQVFELGIKMAPFGHYQICSIPRKIQITTSYVFFQKRLISLVVSSLCSKFHAKSIYQKTLIKDFTILLIVGHGSNYAIRDPHKVWSWNLAKLLIIKSCPKSQSMMGISQVLNVGHKKPRRGVWTIWRRSKSCMVNLSNTNTFHYQLHLKINSIRKLQAWVVSLML